MAPPTLRGAALGGGASIASASSSLGFEFIAMVSRRLRLQKRNSEPETPREAGRRDEEPPRSRLHVASPGDRMPFQDPL